MYCLNSSRGYKSEIRVSPGLVLSEGCESSSPHVFSCYFPYAAATAKSLQSCPTLCEPIDGSPSGSPVHGILQAIILYWVAMPFSIAMCAAAAAAKSLQSCLTLCNPTDGSPPGSPVPEILQARTLEWVAISFSNA